MKKTRVVKQEPYNGVDYNDVVQHSPVERVSPSPSDDEDVELSRLKSKVIETEERYTNMMEKLVSAMDQQATAMEQIAEAAVGNAKALQQLAEASHKQSKKQSGRFREER